MLKKGEGKINEIVYEHTAHRGGKYRLYPNIFDLYALLDDLIEAEATTDYLRITPFYQNAKINRQIEFDSFMFFIECRDSFTEEEEEENILENLEGAESSGSPINLEKGRVLYPLCQWNDPEKFSKSLVNYREYLNICIPEMFKIAKEELNLQGEHLAFGLFCFEIHSE